MLETIPMSNASSNKNEKMRQLLGSYRQALDAAEAVRIVNELASLLEPLDREQYAEAWRWIVAVQELAGTNPSVHERRAKALKDEVVRENKGLIKIVAKNVLGIAARNPDNLAEAEQDGAMGVMRAVDAFDPSRGPWSICARHWIRYYVQTCAHHQVDFPRQRHQRMPPEVAKQANVVRAKHGREPRPDELVCKGQQVTLEQWRAWTERAQMSSFDRRNNAGGDESSNPAYGSEEFIADESTLPERLFEAATFDEKLRRCIEKTSPRNRLILTALFIDGKNTAEVSEEYGISMRRLQELKVILAERLKKALAS